MGVAISITSFLHGHSINSKFHGGGNFDIIVFPNRIENVKRKTGNCISVFPLLLCSWPVRLGFCLMPLHHKQTSGFTLKPQKISGGITHLIHPTRRSYQLMQKESKKTGSGVKFTTVNKKSAATTRLQWTLGGLCVGLTTFGIGSKGIRANRLVIQKGP